MKYINKSKFFFDSLSQYYDEMISFSASLKNRKQFYGKLLRQGISYAADIGCGTGLDSVALCTSGLKVTAFDISPQMIKVARKNARDNKCNIEFNCADTERISKRYFAKFDLVVSMGNTLANLSPVKLGKAAKLMHSLLTKKGMIIIQILNFEKIINENQRIIRIKKIPGEYTIRFYDIHDHYLNFNILRFNSDETTKYELKTTYLYSYFSSDLAKIFGRAGFHKIKNYGSLQLEKFNSASSNDLFLTAVKQ